MLDRIDANIPQAGRNDLELAISPAEAAPTARRVSAASVSLLWSLRLIPAPRRNALRALFAFCREVGEIARSDATPALKLALLADWRAELGLVYARRPQYPVTRALGEAVESFDLSCDEFLAVIRGLEMDVHGYMRAPSLERLDLYCEQTTVAVGRLALRILGAAPQDGARIAAALGCGMQLIGVLRDLSRDADRHQRLYLPRELLRAQGVYATTPSYVLAQPALPQICNVIAAQAAAHLADAERAVAGVPRLARMATTGMLSGYSELLKALLARGWTRLDAPVAVPVWCQTLLHAGDVFALR